LAGDCSAPDGWRDLTTMSDRGLSCVIATLSWDCGGGAADCRVTLLERTVDDSATGAVTALVTAAEAAADAFHGLLATCNSSRTTTTLHPFNGHFFQLNCCHHN